RAAVRRRTAMAESAVRRRAVMAGAAFRWRAAVAGAACRRRNVMAAAGLWRKCLSGSAGRRGVKTDGTEKTSSKAYVCGYSRGCSGNCVDYRSGNGDGKKILSGDSRAELLGSIY